MNRTLLILAAIFSLLIGNMPVSILADETADNQEAEQAASKINSEAEKELGRAAVVNRLKNEFTVEESQINDLHTKGMGYGEIGIALSLAKQMPGGITNENIQKVMDLRQGETKAGWGNVAKQLNLNLGKVVSQTKKIANESKDIETPNTNQSEAKGAFDPKSQRPASTGKPAGVSKPMHTPGGPKGKK